MTCALATYLVEVTYTLRIAGTVAFAVGCALAFFTYAENVDAAAARHMRKLALVMGALALLSLVVWPTPEVWRTMAPPGCFVGERG